MRIKLNFNGEYINSTMRSSDRKAIRKFMLFWTLFLPAILVFQMSALFMEIPPKDIQYVEGRMFETNYYTKYVRYSGHLRAGLLAEVVEEGKNSLTGYYLPLYAIEGDAEELRDRINHPRSQDCRIGYVLGVEDKLTTNREKKYIISLECDGDLVVKPETTVNAYRERAKERMLTAMVWLAACLVGWVFCLGLIQIQWRSET